MELAKKFIRKNIEPKWMVLCRLPLLPPELRPIIQIDEGKSMTYYINELCRRVIYRNNTRTDLLSTIVDALLDNGILGQPIKDGHNKVYKSFSDVIKGKVGRFCENLLGKGVYYSGRTFGRSDIVVCPSLSLHKGGLPLEIAIKLLQKFVIHGLTRQHLVLNIGVAKRKIQEKELVIWKMLKEVM
ncbi:DNA-directed RNA polymerase subunit beta' [Bienertia sinuspersici]